MAQYNAIKAAVNAYIKANGRKEITGQILNSVLNATIDSLGKYSQFAGEAMPTTDPGTPDQNVTYLAGTAGTYTDFGGITLDPQEIALLMWDGEWHKHTMLIGIQEVTASVDNTPGVPSVDVNYADGDLDLAFHNIKGDQGNQGEAAGFGSVTANVDANIGSPGVSVETSGTNAAKNFTFHFTNLKGETGVTAVNASVDSSTGVPYVEATLSGQTLSLAFHNMKGEQGNTGSSVDYPYTLVNNVTTNDATQGLSAAMGVYLQGEFKQLDEDVNGIPGTDLQVTQAITQGTAVSVSSVHLFDEILHAGETYTIRMSGDAASSIALYMKDNSGTSQNCLWNEGTATEATATNKSFTTSVREYTCKPSVDIYKYAFYVAAANAVATGNMVMEVTKAGFPGLSQKVQTLQTDVQDLNDDVAELGGKIYSTIAESGKTNGKYIKYSDGASTSTGTYFDTFTFPNKGYEKVQVKVGLSDSNAAAIAFYNGNTYISGIQGHSGTDWYEGNVPSGCNRIVITNRNTTLPTPEIYAFNNKVYNNGDVSMDGIFREFPYIFHIAPDGFLYDGSNGNKLIPGESIGAVEVASRLGFKFIEANVFYTSDGKVVVMHGNNGNFGNTIMSLDGTDPTDTAISSVTLSYIKTYLRYKSAEQKYQEICTLEEFVIACKENNIGVLLRLGDKDMADLCIRYLGKRRVILSDMGVASRSYFDGVLAVWNNTATITPDNIINAARSYGRPFIYSAGPTLVNALETAGQFDDLVKQMHEEGFMIGSAYVSEAMQQFLIQHGADYIASSSFVNPFSDPNHECIDLDGDASQFVTTGTIAGKVATLAPGDTITCASEDAVPLGKGVLRIRFNGELSIKFGSLGTRTFASDGSSLLVFSDYFLRRKTQLTITAVGATTITTLVYMTSIC